MLVLASWVSIAKQGIRNMSKKWHWTDVLGIRQSKEKTGPKERPTGYGWTYKAADRDLEKKKHRKR